MNDVAIAQRSRDTAPPALRDGDLLAALDLGSNSFHMVVARHTLGQLRIVDRLRETVRMAEGLDAKGGLAPAVRQRALECLARFGQRIADIPPQRVRAVATNTVRALASPQAFLVPAETALGHAIEVVSGREEARLVYLGVAHAQPPRPGQTRLVIDIGGGSTECIIGSGFDARERESLQVGCVASTRRFFGNGKLTRKKWREAAIEVEAEFQQFAGRYRSVGWDEVIGSSGTIKAIGEICAAMKLTKGAVTAEALLQVRDRMLAAGQIDAIDLPGLSGDRRPVLAGGVLALEAAFDVLGLHRMMVSKAALREGVLYDMLGRGGADDPREASVDALMRRYGVDAAQATRVLAVAMRLFDQVAEAWSLDADARQLLAWAARLHELGLAIAHSQYHVHGTYVLANSDIAGFSQQDQRFLAALVRTHRRGIPKSAFDALPDRLVPAARRCAALLRLAVLLNRSQENAPLPELTLSAAEGEL
ncbi:MAG TPA: exopolyphosphatase, partial [Xanthomonadaceae bacterium]|nr:exopolyphosphatase [Xanthomonadaceae bacterium]